MQPRPPHFHFSNICLFFAVLSFSRERHLLCRPLGPQNSFLKRKKVKLLLPSSISILGQPPFRKEISTPLSSNELKWCQNITKSGFPLSQPCIQRHWHVFGLGIWTFLWSFLRIIYSEGPIRWGEGRPSSAGKIIVDKIKMSWFLRVFLLKNCLSRNFKVIIDDFQAQGNKTRIPAGDEVRPNNWKIQSQISISIFERSGSK